MVQTKLVFPQNRAPENRRVGVSLFVLFISQVKAEKEAA